MKVEINNKVISSNYEEWKIEFNKLREEKKDWINVNNAELLVKYIFESDLKEFKESIKNVYGVSGASIDTCHIECESYFDESSEPKLHDLAFTSNTPGCEDILFTVDAKITEPNHFSIHEMYDKSESLSCKTNNYKLDDRIDAIYKSITGDLDIRNNDKFIDFLYLKYQLFTDLAGTVAKAKKVGLKKAMLLVCAFDSDKVESDKKDFNKFLEFLGYDVDSCYTEIPYKFSTNLDSDTNFKTKYDDSVEVSIAFVELTNK